MDMTKKQKLLTFFSILVLITASIFVLFSFDVFNTSRDSPITITSNLDFATKANIYNWKGKGDQYSPYLIEGNSIVSKADSQNAITISNTSVYFIIRGNTLRAEGKDSSGIFFSNVSNALIENNIIRGSGANGIIISYGQSIVILANNIRFNTVHGISLSYSEDITISINSINGNGNDGIRIVNSMNILIQKNLLDNNNNGLTISSYSKISITSNQAKKMHVAVIS